MEEAVPRAPLFTVGHSNRSLETFLELLRAHGVRTVVDVRRFPRSRRHPHFNRARLQSSLEANGIEYRHLPALGGLREPRLDSINGGWEDPGFRGFADYMQTAEFAEALAQLLDLAQCTPPAALLCAEALPWRCHRWLIADALVARGVPVVHIVGLDRSAPHELTPFARVEEGRVIYPARADHEPTALG